MVIRKLLPPAALLTLCTLSGCGGGASAPAPRPPHKHVSTPQPTTVALAPVVPTQPSPTAPPAPTIAPRPTARPPTVPPPTATARPVQPVRPIPPTSAPTVPPALHLVSASLQPGVVPAGGTVHASVVTTGAVQRVEVYLGSGAPSAPAPATYTLAPVGPGRWEGGGTAPSVVGEYHFAVGLFDRAGSRTVADNDGWNIQVNGQPTAAPVAAQVQPLPADIPLAPPFSYGNPIAAQFNAGGTAVNGSEVVSTTRPDVAPAVVAQFYSLHLPRAGWNVAPSTLPAPGATSFSIYATAPGTAGTRVCIVQYSGSTIYIFYGTISGQ